MPVCEQGRLALPPHLLAHELLVSVAVTAAMQRTPVGARSEGLRLRGERRRAGGRTVSGSL